MDWQFHVYQLTLDHRQVVDPAEPGAVITSCLCGHWEHLGPCRWPHRSSYEVISEQLVIRTVFCANEEEVETVLEAISSGLREKREWTVAHSEMVSPTVEEQAIGNRWVTSSRETQSR